MQRFLSTFGWCFALALAVGCGSSSKDGGNAGNSGTGGSGADKLAAATPTGPVSTTDESRDLSSLSSDESQKYCKDIVSYNNTTLDQEQAHKVSCSIVALITLSFGGASKESQLACQTTFQNCINKPIVPATDDGCAHTKLNTCKGVTVGAYDTCVREQIGLSRVAYSDFASLSFEQICTPATPSDGTAGAAGTSSTGTNGLPPSCVPIQAKCPDLFETSSTTNTGDGGAGGTAGSGAGGSAGSGAGGSGGATAGAGGTAGSGGA